MTETGQKDTRWIATIVLCVGVLMIVLDATVVNVALPSIQNDLGFTNSSLAWVVNAYLIAFAGLLLLAGRLGDLVGRFTVFMCGLAVFTSASLLCGLANSQATLVAARFIQGVGGAMTSAVVLGMIVTMFTDARERARAIGMFGFVASAGGSIGLLAGGVLTESINWHWIFFVNIPIGIGTALFAWRLIQHDKGIGMAKGADVIGAFLVTAALMLLVYTIVKPAAEKGWGATETLVLGAGAIALMVLFVAREATAKSPLMPLRIFRSRNVAGANLVQFLSVSGMFATFFLGALYLQRIQHYSPLEIGLAFLPTTLVMGTLSLRYAEVFITKFGARTTLVPGLLLIAAALLVFTRAPVDGNYFVNVLPVMLLLGAGAGSAFPSLMTLSMSGATPQDAGLASGLVNTTVQVGGAVGLAVLATLSATRTDNLIAGGTSKPEALTSGYHLGFIIGASLVGAAVAVAVTVIRPEGAVAAPAHAQDGADPALPEAA
jgi:EmrB/QacA subfamily drug resistance transporter